jgi:hypothetical protein
MSNLGMLYCHSVQDLPAPLPYYKIEVGMWYYYHRYFVNDDWNIDIKESDTIWTRNILTFREEDMSSWFWDRVQFRDSRIGEILEGLGE